MSKLPFQLHLGDCLETLRSLPDNCVDSVVTDPPYGLEFMGKDWDAPWKSDRRQVFDGTLTDVRENPFGRSKVRYGTGASYGGHVGQMQAFQLWATEIFTECLRVLKPGGHLLSFGGSRTYHRMASAVEDAGFEIRDQIMWVYGSGFPKSHNGPWGGTALKPAHEPIVMARKPLVGTVAENVLAFGTGALNVDGCRVAGEHTCTPRLTANANMNDDGWQKIGKAAESVTAAGRWPANLIHDGHPDVVAGFPAKAGASAPVKGTEASAASVGNVTGERARVPGAFHADTGSAARFFYCAKASKSDRGGENNHPTVKPTDLMRYLCRLVTPPGGVVLDPFMGSGSTGKAAMLEGFRFIGIDRELPYLNVAKQRITHSYLEKEGW